MAEQMDTTVQISVRSLSDTDAEVLRLPEMEHGGIAQKEGILYLRNGDRICS